MIALPIKALLKVTLNFTDANKVSEIIGRMRWDSLVPAQNRARIDRLFNGEPPFVSEAESAAEGIQTNVNDLKAAKIAHDARAQYENAFIRPTLFFNVDIDIKPAHQQKEWSRIATKKLNRILKGNSKFNNVLKSDFAQVVLHGIGPSVWNAKGDPISDAVGIEDVLLPSNTRVDFENLCHFAVYREYTPARFYAMTHGKAVDPGWNMKAVMGALDRIKDDTSMTANPGNWALQPEKLAEQMRANGGYWASNIVPAIKVWDFYFRNEESDKESWERRMLLDFDGDDYSDEFLFNPPGKRSYASSWQQLIHCYFADGANVAPFLYHSVRSLGFLLYAVCHLQNRLMCRFSDNVFQQMMWFFRVSMNDDQERLEKVDLTHMGVIPQGLDFIPAAERFTPDFNLINSAMQLYRGIISDNSASFITNDMDVGEKDPTATYTMAKANAAATLISSMLSQAYFYAGFQYREICRRFCLKDSRNEDVKEFQDALRKEGIPEEALDFKRWDVQPETVLGQGNKFLEIQQADRLMAVRNLHDPDAQRQILHMYDEVNSDPKMADMLVPMKQKATSDTVHDAQLASGALMQGLPVALKQGINHQEYAETLLTAMAVVIQGIEQSGGMATAEQIIGLQNTASAVQEHIQIVAQDDNEKARVKGYMDALGKMMNLVEAYIERLQEQQQKSGAGTDPEAQGKIVAMQTLAQAKAQNMQMSAAQKAQQKQQSFAAQEARTQQQHDLDMSRQIQDQQVSNAAEDLKTAAQIRREGAKPQNANQS